MKVKMTNCIRCGACSSVCPVNAIEVSDSQVRVDKSCTNCGLCERVCPMRAVEIER
jgi:ferredoxin